MTAFDADGHEIKPVGELQHLCEMGGQFDEASATISVYSEQLDRHKVTSILGVQPTNAWNPGERHPIGNRGVTRAVEWGKWGAEKGIRAEKGISTFSLLSFSLCGRVETGEVACLHRDGGACAGQPIGWVGCVRVALVQSGERRAAIQTKGYEQFVTRSAAAFGRGGKMTRSKRLW